MYFSAAQHDILFSKYKFDLLGTELQRRPSQYLHKEGDRVVVYSLKDQRSIRGTVRWTGPILISKSVSRPPVIFVGLETVSCTLYHKWENFVGLPLNCVNFTALGMAFVKPLGEK